MTTQGSSSADREKTIKDWEKSQNSGSASLLGDDKNKRKGMFIFVIAVLGALLLVYMLKQPKDTKVAHADGNLSLADRKRVEPLKQQEKESSPPANTTQAESPDEARLRTQREQMDMQLREQKRRMLEARMKSAIMPQQGQGGGAGGEIATSSTANPILPPEQKGAQDSNSKFARAVSGSEVQVSRAGEIDNLEYKILQGKIIDAVTEPRAISDLPGMICAVVQQDVFAQVGRQVLIPWGSRVCGVYSADIKKGQTRIFTIFNRLVRPDGVQVTLDSAASDQLGSSGMGGKVDTHFATIFGTSALLSIMGAGSATIGVGSGDQYNSQAYYRMQVQEAAAESAKTVLGTYANIPPTITVAQGTRIRIYVNRDLDFTSAYQTQMDAAKRSGVTFLE
ncbi:TrbI/VirB10 family protein [Xanthomonas albilineans]|uniref:TrbI/VirB10 family protein n=1 Tax=Xanthomonas albilineans TaxID=29447 RepID=UPI0005F31199|nr:TrbI/VirB10 family protein [Xanthomonas albilineans]